MLMTIAVLTIDVTFPPLTAVVFLHPILCLFQLAA
jgi:hypothetical protein